MISAKKQDENGNRTTIPWHPETKFHILPKEILLLILQWAISFFE